MYKYIKDLLIEIVEFSGISQLNTLDYYTPCAIVYLSRIILLKCYLLHGKSNGVNSDILLKRQHRTKCNFQTLTLPIIKKLYTCRKKIIFICFRWFVVQFFFKLKKYPLKFLWTDFFAETFFSQFKYYCSRYHFFNFEVFLNSFLTRCI